MKTYNLNNPEKVEKQLKNFNKNTMNKSSFIVLVHADWCYHCKNLRPIWNDIKKKVKEKNLNIDFLDINDTVRDIILSKYKNNQLVPLLNNVSGFPTIIGVKHIRDDVNKGIVFQDERTQEHLISFLRKLVSKK